MNAGGTLLSIFGVITGFAYLARSFLILYNVHRFEEGLEDDDAFNNDDDSIWYVPRLFYSAGIFRNAIKILFRLVYISTMFVGFFFLIVSCFMLYGSTKVSKFSQLTQKKVFLSC
jgi:hypothetical protein